MEHVGRRDDDGILGQTSQFVDPGQPLRLPAGKVRIALDHLVCANAAAIDLRLPEMAEAHQRMLAAPFLATGNARALNPPERPLRRVLSGRHADTGFFHLIGEGVQHADHNHPVGAAVQAGLHDGRDLMTAVEDARMREDQHPAGAEGGRQVPLPRQVQPLECAPGAHGLVLAAVERVDLLLKFPAVKLHGLRHRPRSFRTS